MAKIYSKDKDYSQILQEVHERIRLKMLRNQHKREALELQTILQEIKMVAKDFNNAESGLIGTELWEQYEELIQKTFEVQSQYHNSSFQAHTLFNRSYKKSKLKTSADDIFEEDLAALLTAGEILGGNENIDIEYFLFGSKASGTKASQKYNPLDLIDDENVKSLLLKLAEKENKKTSTEVKNATGKIDISGKAVTLNYSKDLPFKVERLMTLMKDATFSAKNYSSGWKPETKKDWAKIGLHLGNSNLYKAVTGALSEIQMGYKQQNAFFFRGMNTILGNNHGYGNIATTHFSHLRFIYELRGSGLLDENGLVLPVKFLIYNDPASDAIYVKSTASIILEALDSATRNNNLLGDISLSASKVKS